MDFEHSRIILIYRQSLTMNFTSPSFFRLTIVKRKLIIGMAIGSAYTQAHDTYINNNRRKRDITIIIVIISITTLFSLIDTVSRILLI